MSKDAQAGDSNRLVGGDVSRAAVSAENRFARLVEHSPLSTQFFAPDGRVRSVNKAWERLFGITLSDIADYNVLEDQQLVALGIMPLVRRGFAGEAVQIPAVGYVPEMGIHAGQERWCSASIYPVLDSDGTVLEIVLSHHDLTEQHRAERELRESEERLRLGLEAGGTGTWDWMIPENRLTWSDRVYGFHGLSREDFEPTLDKFATLVHPDDLERVQAQIAASIRDRAPYITEFRVVQPSGEIRWIATQGTVHYGADGTPLRMLGATSDVTGRRLGEWLLAAQMQVLEMIATGAALDETFIAIARLVEQQSSLTLCSICLLDPHSRCLQRASAPSLPPALVEQLEVAALGEAAGPTGTAIRTGQRSVASDLSNEEWAQHARIVSPHGLQAAWSQPILGKEGQAVGAVTHYSRQARIPSDADFQLLSTAAHLAGIAVGREHADAVEKTLNRVGRAMMEQTDVQPLVQAITDAGTELSHAEFGAFFYNTINADGEQMMLYTLSGAGQESFARFPMPRPTELFGPTFRGETVVRAADITQDARYGRNSPYHGIPAGHFPVRSYLAVPVRSRAGEVIGGLFFGHSEPGIFREEAETLISGLAVQAGLVLENASLLRQVQGSEAKFRQLANTIPQLAWMAKPDGWIFWYNEQWHQYTGITSDELDGWGWESIHDPEMLPEVKRRWQASLDSGEPFEMEFPLRSANGEFRWFLTRVNPLRNDDGTLLLWFGTNTDVSDQQQQKRELAASEARLRSAVEAERAARAEAERVSRMKDEFLSTLSHELRTPLNAILGWAQILGRSGHSAADLAAGLATIERNARSQARIVEDLLDMSRIISGKVRLDVQRVELAALVHAAVETLRPAAEAKQIQLQVNLDPSIGPVSGDPSRLQQVFWNLISNSVKFTPRGGRIQVLLQRVDSQVEIRVIDSGEGIKAGFLPLVFNRFQQEDASTTRRHGGLGLGLSIVKQLVELHGGTVRAHSAGEGQGATFVVALPVTALVPDRRGVSARLHAPVESTATHADACHSLAGVRVLVVDDEPDARALVERLLVDCDALVTTAATTQDAIAHLLKSGFDVLVSDIGMPGEDGYSLIRRVRELDSSMSSIPALAMTAYARSEDRQRAIDAGFGLHVTKPVEPSELIALVASLAQRP